MTSKHDCPTKEESADYSSMTKRQLKKAYTKGEIGLSDAMYELVLTHGMIQGDAFEYLGL